MVTSYFYNCDFRIEIYVSFLLTDTTYKNNQQNRLSDALENFGTLQLYSFFGCGVILSGCVKAESERQGRRLFEKRSKLIYLVASVGECTRSCYTSLDRISVSLGY